MAPLWPGSTSLQRMEAIAQLGHEVLPIDSTGLRGPNASSHFCWRVMRRLCGSLDLSGINKEIVQVVKSRLPDVVWVDKGSVIKRRTLTYLKILCPQILLVHYNPDDPFGGIRRGWRRFLRAAGAYDVHFVPRDENILEYRGIGCQHVHRFHRGFDPDMRRPLFVSDSDRKAYGSEVSFVGTWEKERERSLNHLVSNKVDVAIFGNHWNRGRHWDTLQSVWRGPAIYGLEYTKALCSVDICLCFLNKNNRDKQNSRTLEIPACGGFMLAERTDEHLKLFEEGKEAEFFSSDQELLDKIRYYLAHPHERVRIAEKGHDRCLKSGYRNQDRIAQMLEVVGSLKGTNG